MKRSSKQKQNDTAFYLSIWHTREHKCEQCGRYLGSEPLTIYFHHILAKSKYKQYRHSSWNIALVCGDCHSQCETNIDKTPKLKQRHDELLKQIENGDEIQEYLHKKGVLYPKGGKESPEDY
jgi:5-methylcytosine-specific restriction endonuclease McrA